MNQATPLTGKQRRHLRSLGNRLSATIHLGKDGVTDRFLENLSEEFGHRELVKVAINRNSERSAKEIAESLGGLPQVHWVQTIGRTVMLYRAGDPAEIVLP